MKYLKYRYSGGGSAGSYINLFSGAEIAAECNNSDNFMHYKKKQILQSFNVLQNNFSWGI